MSPLSLARYYTPIVCLMGLMLLNALAQPAAFDPLTAAQNPRLQFQTGSSAQQVGDLSAQEVQMAQAVLKPDFQDNPEALRVLYVGNSQSMAIMDRLPGDLTSPQWLQVLLARHRMSPGPSIEVRLGSVPNLTMSEFLIKLVTAGEQARPINIFLGSMVLEEWRGLGVRDQVLSLTQSPAVNDDLAELIAANPDLPFASKTLSSVLPSRASSQTTVSGPIELQRDPFASDLERDIQTQMERQLPLFAARPQLYGQIILWYHGLRNQLLGITSATARPIPEATYRASLELLELSLRYARSKGIHVVLYLAPIRPIQPNPSLPTDVARFRHDISAVCSHYSVTCLDYIDLVPEKLWTNYTDEAVGTSGQRDFAHFTGAAHKLLAERLAADISPLTADWAHEKEAHRP